MFHNPLQARLQKGRNKAHEKIDKNMWTKVGMERDRPANNGELTVYLSAGVSVRTQAIYPLSSQFHAHKLPGF